MRFDETEFYKHFGDAEWKVTTNDGRMFKSANWNYRHEDSGKKEMLVTIHPPMQKTETKARTKNGRK